jgi:hypothetical protein
VCALHTATQLCAAVFAPNASSQHEEAAELAGLDEEAELPLEELLARYGNYHLAAAGGDVGVGDGGDEAEASGDEDMPGEQAAAVEAWFLVTAVSVCSLPAVPREPPTAGCHHLTSLHHHFTACLCRRSAAQAAARACEERGTCRGADRGRCSGRQQAGG